MLSADLLHVTFCELRTLLRAANPCDEKSKETLTMQAPPNSELRLHLQSLIDDEAQTAPAPLCAASYLVGNVYTLSEGPFQCFDHGRR